MAGSLDGIKVVDLSRGREDQASASARQAKRELLVLGRGEAVALVEAADLLEGADTHDEVTSCRGS